jgi:threonine aldolase
MISTMRRHRKLFGGGMRQSGIIAAGALYALENNIERLQEDHAAAQVIAQAISETDGLELQPQVVDTNIVIFRIDPQIGHARDFCDQAKSEGVWMLPFSTEHVRAVTHLHVSRQDAGMAGQIIRDVVGSLTSV